MESDSVKTVFKITVTLIFIVMLTFFSSAADFTDSLDSETKELLFSMGIESTEFESIFNITSKDLFDTIVGVFKGNMKEPMRFLVTACSAVLLMALLESLTVFSDKSKMIFETVGSLFAVAVSIPSMTDVIRSSVAAVETAGGFMKALIPVLAGVIAASGAALTSVFWQSAVFSASQTVASVATRIMSPCCGLIMGIGVLDSINADMKMSSVAEAVKKTAVWIFSTSATLFTAFLSLKGILAGNADTLTAKGAKLLIGTLPVVGSQISEAYSSVMGSLSLVRSSTAVFAMAALFICVLPSVIRLVLWIFALKATSLAATLLGQTKAASLMKCCSTALTMLNMCIVFTAVLFIISIGIVLKIRTGA